MNQPVLLGIDGGGTSTTAWLADSTGMVLGRGRSGASNAKAVGTAVARRSLEQAITQAFSDAGLPPATVAVACFGLAGFDRPEDKRLIEAWSKELGWARQLVLVNDGDLLLAAGTPEGWGIGVISGTGSIAVGRSLDGRSARAGGWGYLFGDEGSAYSVAVAALRWIARASDGRDPVLPGEDPLHRMVCEALGVARPEDLIGKLYRPEVDRTRVAGLAPIVVAAAFAHSHAASTILNSCVDELAAAALGVARTLRFLDSSSRNLPPLVLAGGFLLSTPALSSALVARLQLAGLVPASVTPVPDPVFGALTLARRALDF